MQRFSTLILRIGISLVILYFSSQQFINPSAWTTYLPSWTENLPINQNQFIYLNALFELIFGLSLYAGFYTRIVATLLAFHMLSIVFSIGYNPTGIRDFGIFIALVSIALNEKNNWSMDEYLHPNSQDPKRI